MKVTYSILSQEIGSYEYKYGDIVGIDNRVWASGGEDIYRVRNNKTKVVYRNRFTTRYQAMKFIKTKHGGLNENHRRRSC